MKDLSNLDNLLESLPKPFKVIDKVYDKETIWISKSECQRELGISRATIQKALKGHKFSDKYRYDILKVA